MPHLGSRLVEGGLTIVANDRTPVPDQYRMFFNLSHLITFEDVSSAYVANAEGHQGGNEFLEELKVELLEKRVSVNEDFVCVVARREL